MFRIYRAIVQPIEAICNSVTKASEIGNKYLDELDKTVNKEIVEAAKRRRLELKDVLVEYENSMEGVPQKIIDELDQYDI